MNRPALLLALLVPALLALGVAPPPRKAQAKQPPAKVKDAPAPAPGPSRSWIVPGLELDAPQRRTRPGLAFVTAKVTTPKPDSKVKLVWDVECVWDNEDTECEWEVRDGNRLQLVIPDDSGVVRVSAIAIVDGEPTSDKLAKTTIEMTYTPRRKKGVDPPAAAAAAATAKAGKVVRAIFVIDSEADDPNLTALAKSVGLRNRLRAAGVSVEIHEKATAPASFSRYIQDAGGTPCMILATDAKRVRKAIRIPATEEAIVATLENAP